MLLVISFNRLLAVVFFLQYRIWNTKQNINISIAICYLCAVIACATFHACGCRVYYDDVALFYICPWETPCSTIYPVVSYYTITVLVKTGIFGVPGDIFWLKKFFTIIEAKCDASVSKCFGVNFIKLASLKLFITQLR